MTVVIPAEIPVINPEDIPMVAMEVDPELQVPPDVRSVRLAVEPLQILPGPEIDAGRGFTVS